MTVNVEPINVTAAPVVLAATVSSPPLDVDVTNIQPISIDIGAAELALSVVDTPTTVSVSLQGAQGPAGPRGPVGDGGFTYTRTEAAATWIIPNELGRMPAGVLIVVDGEVVEADVIPTVDTIVLVFASPQSGQAEIV